jgi:hypothetical protein
VRRSKSCCAARVELLVRSKYTELPIVGLVSATSYFSRNSRRRCCSDVLGHSGWEDIRLLILSVVEELIRHGYTKLFMIELRTIVHRFVCRIVNCSAQYAIRTVVRHTAVSHPTIILCCNLRHTVLGPKSWHYALDTLHAFQCDLVDSTTNNATSYSIQSAATQYYSRL